MHKTCWIVRPNGCWEWVYSLDGRGYGRVWIDGRMHRAHRVSYERFVGPIPEGREICHSCDNPPCINPDHLWAGTKQQNMLDCSLKGRMTKKRKGEENRNAKLRDLDVIAVKVWLGLGYMNKDIASAFGLDRSAISNIKTGKTWAHVRVPGGMA